MRRTTALTGLDRKTVRRYIEAAAEAGLQRAGGELQLTDGLIGAVCEAVRPLRPNGHGESWGLLGAHREKIKGWLKDDDLTLVKVHALLGRQGVAVPYRTLHRYAVAAWQFFGGVFAVVIPDNLSPVVAKADPIAPRFTDAFKEYAQSRGFVVDAARAGTPTDKPRVERSVPFVRRSFFAGEHFLDLADGQTRAVRWCLETAGMRIHGTIQARPLEVFRAEEAARLLPMPTTPYVVPIYATAKVHRDHHIEVGRALYSIPGNLIGHKVEVRADGALVKAYHRGQLVKVHPRMQPGGRSTHAEDLPAERTVYALRDINQLRRMATTHGEHVGRFADTLLDTPLPWTRMRHVYRLLGLVRRFGAERVDDACHSALDVDTINIGFVGRLLERAAERNQLPNTKRRVVRGRFARDASEFAVGRGAQ